MNATLKIHFAASAAQSVQVVLGNVLSRVSRLSERISTSLREQHEAERAIEQLSALNERQLRDIGILRSDIEAAVRGRRPISR